MSAYLNIKNLDLELEGRAVLKQVRFELELYQIGALIGASGSGKTALLRCIAGLNQVSAGQVVCAGETVNSSRLLKSPQHRNIGMVFQYPALFPHLTVRKNIGFGIQKIGKTEQRKIIDELLEMTGLEKLAHRLPSQLSGGEQQRVTIARAMARQPQLLLLDEPFSAQDPEIRASLASDVVDIIRAKKQTALIVTHDQNEAFAITDTMAIMDNGRVLQQGSCYDLYHKPSSRMVADFVGLGVFAQGEVLAENKISSTVGVIGGELDPDLSKGDKVEILLRPDDIIHDDDSEVTAKILDKSFRGAVFLYTLLFRDRQKLYCYAPSHHNHHIGEEIGIRLEVDHIICFK